MRAEPARPPQSNSRTSGTKKMSLSQGAVLPGLGGFPKVQFTTAAGGRFGVFAHTTLSMHLHTRE